MKGTVCTDAYVPGVQAGRHFLTHFRFLTRRRFVAFDLPVDVADGADPGNEV